jgi:hypothetical protein
MRRGPSHGTRGRRVLLGVVAIATVALTACRIPSPLTYPLQLTPPVDATAEVKQLLGTPPPPPAASPAEVARQLAIALTTQHEGCEVLTIAQVIWVAPTPPATAAIEVRGLCDDSVDGIWYEITITGDNQVGWVLATATSQHICSRGVSGAVCL